MENKQLINYKQLIIKKYGTLNNYANKLGISKQYLDRILSGKNSPLKYIIIIKKEFEHDARTITN